MTKPGPPLLERPGFACHTRSCAAGFAPPRAGRPAGRRNCDPRSPTAGSQLADEDGDLLGGCPAIADRTVDDIGGPSIYPSAEVHADRRLPGVAVKTSASARPCFKLMSRPLAPLARQPRSTDFLSPMCDGTGNENRGRDRRGAGKAGAAVLCGRGRIRATVRSLPPLCQNVRMKKDFSCLYHCTA